MPVDNTYQAIATQTLGSAAASVTFSSIPSTYTDLVLVINAGGSIAGNGINLRFNSDTATNYSDTGMWGTGSSAASGRHTSITSASVTIAVGVTNNPSDTQVILNIMNYANTTTYKSLLSRSNNASASAAYPGTEAIVAMWRSTSAVNEITLLCGANFVIGSTFNLYGIKAA
jgi:hypothetical protein